MSRKRERSRYRPDWDVLDRRELPTAGVTASLSGGVLAVVGTSSTAPIVIDVFASATRKGITGLVIVEGVGAFKASQVHYVVVGEVTGEKVVVHRSKRWNPPIQILTPVALPSPTPAPTAAPVPAPTPSPNPIPQPPANLSANEQAIVDLVNQVRRQNGLAALSVNSKLIQAARIHSNDMAALNRMAHDLPGAALPGLAGRARFVGYQYSSMGENIAYNFPDPTSAMNAWMNSPGHRANILASDYTEIGVGIAFDRQGSPYYCQVFGRPA